MRRGALALTRAVHTLVYLGVCWGIAELVWSGATDRRGRRTAVAAAVVAAETGVYTLNGRRCPLTPVAAALGGDPETGADICLPRPLARHIPGLTTPVLLLALGLHLRAWRMSRAPFAPA